MITMMATMRPVNGGGMEERCGGEGQSQGKGLGPICNASPSNPAWADRKPPANANGFANERDETLAKPNETRRMRRCVAPVHHGGYGQPGGFKNAYFFYFINRLHHSRLVALLPVLVTSGCFLLQFATPKQQKKGRVANMGTINSRTRKDGTIFYTAQIEIMRDGKTVFSQAHTFDRESIAKAGS